MLRVVYGAYLTTVFGAVYRRSMHVKLLPLVVSEAVPKRCAIFVL